MRPLHWEFAAEAVGLLCKPLFSKWKKGIILTQ